MRAIKGVIVHCAATRSDWWKSKSTAQKVKEIRRWHLDRGWSDIGYHYLIDRNGKIAEGRPVSKKGAHVRGHNTGTIGVCLLGGHGSAETDRFEEHFTPAQEKSLMEFIGGVRAEYGMDISVTGHNQYAAKACPGFNVPKWLAEDIPEAPAAKPQGIGAIIAAIIRSIFGGKP